MIIIIILLGSALTLSIIAYFFFGGLPDSRTKPGKRVQLLFLASGLCIVGALAAGILIKIQEKTGVVTGLSGGIESDARQWMSAQQNTAPSANQPGDNIRILRDGLAFLRNHVSIGNSPEAQAVIHRYSGLPEHPTRLLTRDEEIQYYEGAKAVYQIINNVAQTPQ